MSRYFTDQTFAFFRALARNNKREWFHAHKARYDEHVKVPFQQLIGDLAAPLAKVSGHYRADPRGVGGSLFRIQRDTRFSSDKTPYKTWAGARFFHERAKQVTAPVFYLHIQPGRCFVGAGLWHPDPPVQRRVREFIADNPAAWKRAVHGAAFRRRYTMDGDSLVRPPRGFEPDHELIEDLKRKDFVASAPLDAAVVLGPKLDQAVAGHLRGVAPLVDYLCAALDLPF